MGNRKTNLLVLIIILLSYGSAVPFYLQMNGETLSLSAEQVPLQSILMELSSKYGIKTRIDPTLNPNITISFTNRDFQKGLEGILRPHAHVFVWEKIDGPFGSIPRLVEIHVFKAGKKENIRLLHSQSTLQTVVDPQTGIRYLTDVVLIKLRPAMTTLAFQSFLNQIDGILDGAVPGVGVYRIRLPAGANVPKVIDQISRHPGIASAEPDLVYGSHFPARAADHPTPQPSIPGPDAPQGVPVAILDSGMRDFASVGNSVVAALDGLKPGEPISDSSGHGTQMALIVSGAVRPYGTETPSGERNPIIPIRVFDQNGLTSGFTIMEAVTFAAKNGARVMSLSWGSDAHSKFLEDTFKMTQSQGIITLASAGNEPTGLPVYPAAYPSVIGVGALNSTGERWEKSNFGDFVNIYAPGIANLPVGFQGNPGIYAGTSISTAYTANRIADYLTDHLEATLPEILRNLGSSPE